MSCIFKPLVQLKINKIKKEFSIFECEKIVNIWKKNNINEREIDKVLEYLQNIIYNIIFTYRNFEYETFSFRFDKL